MGSSDENRDAVAEQRQQRQRRRRRRRQRRTCVAFLFGEARTCMEARTSIENCRVRVLVLCTPPRHDRMRVGGPSGL